jgi:hypothetical protein
VKEKAVEDVRNAEGGAKVSVETHRSVDFTG